MNKKIFDIVIVGGGAVGCTLALALAKTGFFSIAVIEASHAETVWDALSYYHRVSAITLASKQILCELNVWSKIKSQRISPFRQISILDQVTQTDLHFAAEEIAQAALGFIVENNLLQCFLRQALQDFSNIQFFSATKLLEIKQEENTISLIDHHQNQYQAKLAIAADGANSWLRNQSEIEVIKKNYEESALVTHVTTEYPHAGIARQIFTPEGPLAFLPLAESNLSSIVWTLPTVKAQKLYNAPAKMFVEELQNVFTNYLGKIQGISKRYHFPLYAQEAKNYFASRIVLVGDAAHTVHPLAGQGINIGFLDAVALAEVIIDAKTVGRDYAGQHTLRKYERWRRADNMNLLLGIDWLHALFATTGSVMPSLRALGLKTTAHLPWLKKILMQHAVGKRSRLPRLAM